MKTQTKKLKVQSFRSLNSFLPLLAAWALFQGQNIALARESTSQFPSRLSVGNQTRQQLKLDVEKIKNWGVYNSLTKMGMNPKSDVDAVDAWSLQEGSREVIVAVIDTGIDLTHQDLVKNLWRDPSSTQPDSFGMNFVNPGRNPIDVHGHGTHVAGIIGSELDPKLGVSGVAHRVSIMPLKYYSESGSGAVNLSHTIDAINYAVDHGARVINYSGGGPEFSDKEYQAIRRAEEKGILFVAAAGNESQDIDQAKNFYFPASYSNSEVPVYKISDRRRPDNMIVVAATDRKNNLIAASNWGKKSVDVAAPGEDILSTLPGGRSGYMSGTSQATAFVTGAAALLLSENPNLSPQEVRKILIDTVDSVAQLKGKVLAGGHVNVYSALKKARQSIHQQKAILAQSQVRQ